RLVPRVEDRPKGGKPFTGGTGRRRARLLGPRVEPAHRRCTAAAPELVDGAEQGGERHGLDDRALVEAGEGSVHELPAGTPAPRGEGDDSAGGAAGLVQVEDGEVGQELVGGEHLAAAVGEVGGQAG